MLPFVRAHVSVVKRARNRLTERRASPNSDGRTQVLPEISILTSRDVRECRTRRRSAMRVKEKRQLSFHTPTRLLPRYK